MNALRLTAEERARVEAVLARHLPPGALAYAFGSRATGRSRPFSDLDVMIVCERRLTLDERAALSEAFEASDLPFRVDVVEAHDMPDGIRRRALAEGQRLFGEDASSARTAATQPTGESVTSPPPRAA
jgi:predicted nucleotidyltransferase